MRLIPASLLVLSLAQAAAAQAPPAAITPQSTIHLFDGKTLGTLEPWVVDTHRQDPLRVFTVVEQVDGAPAIRVSGEKWGGLISRDSYRDYHLVVEFRWGLLTWANRRGRARDSGILVHCQGQPGNTAADMNGPWMRSIEAQVIEGGVGDIIVVAGFEPDGKRLSPAFKALAGTDRDGEPVYDPKGTERVFQSGRLNWFGRDPDWQDRFAFRGKQDVESPFGEWTRLEVIAKGDRVTTIVNGTVVAEAFAATVQEGRILVQSEGAEIFFRKVDLEPIK
jgi:hypothetical protein